MNLYRTLNESEAKEFKQWARDNYKPFSEIKDLWHPVVKAECEKINFENDLFPKYEQLPEHIQDIISKHENEDYTYQACKDLIDDLEANGYTAEFALDASPYWLRKIDGSIHISEEIYMSIKVDFAELAVNEKFENPTIEVDGETRYTEEAQDYFYDKYSEAEDILTKNKIFQR